MQLGCLWDDRKDLLRASLPLTSDRRTRLKSTKPPNHLDCERTKDIYLEDRGTVEWRRILHRVLPKCLCRPRPECEHLFRAVLQTLCVVAYRHRLCCRCVEKECEDRWLRWRYKGLTTFCTPFYRFVVYSSFWPSACGFIPSSVVVKEKKRGKLVWNILRVLGTCGNNNEAINWYNNLQT